MLGTVCILFLMVIATIGICQNSNCILKRVSILCVNFSIKGIIQSNYAERDLFI